MDIDTTDGVSVGATEPQPAAVTPSDGIEQEFAATSEASAGAIPGATPEPQPDPNEVYRRLQSERDRERYEKEQLQRRLQEVEQRQQQLQTQLNPQPATNPYDPQVQPNEWWAWTFEQNNRRVLEEAETRFNRNLGTMLQTSFERTWQEKHPEMSITQVKEFARQRWGIADPTGNLLDDAFKLMTEPQRIQGVAQAAGQRAIQSLNTNTGAQPVRPVANAGSSPNQAYDFDKLVREVNANPSLLNRMSPEFRRAFEREVARTMSIIS